MGSLRVHVVFADGAWFAQGLELDYASEGKTLAQVQEHFERGLKSTVLLKPRATAKRKRRPSSGLFSSQRRRPRGTSAGRTSSPDASSPITARPTPSNSYLTRFSTAN